MKKFKVQSSKFKVQSLFPAALFFLLAAYCSPLTAFGQNDLIKVQNGGRIENWLISNEFPAEIDAGTWENFNRFNVEKLPQKDWLAPFGGAARIRPLVGTQKAGFKIDGQTNPEKSIEPTNTPLPEVGAASSRKTFADVFEITWREHKAENARLDFYNLFGGKIIGTAYAASYVNSPNDEIRFVETDGFTGAIWLNGERIYDGYSLNVKKVAAAKFVKGENLLLVRASGVAGDYWRKDGGWTVTIRFWKTEAEAVKSTEYKSTGAPGTIFYLEGFHVDPVYLQDQRGYSRITLSNTNQYINSLRADPSYGVFLSEIDYLKPYLDTHPEDRDFLRKAVAEGRVGTGGAYNQFNELTIGGESIIRNILYGQAMHEAMLGRRAKSLSLWDVFGHAPQISQIARKSGFNGVAWSKKIPGFEPFFKDYALDGSSLLHRRVDYAYSFSGFGSGKNYTLDNFRATTERKFQETQTFNSAVDLRINAADFTPPWTNLAGNVEKLETNKPQIRVTGQAQDLYFDALDKEIANGKVKPPVTSRDKLFFHVGVMAARSDLKVAHRLSENMTLTAEKFGAIAYLRGAKYPDPALDKAWRQIFFGSHHDAITGTPSDSAFLDLVHGYREAFELSKNALNDSLQFIAEQIDTGSKFKANSSKLNPIAVFNSSNWTRSDVVRLKVNFADRDFNYDLVDGNGSIVEFEMDEYRAGENRREIEFVAKDVPSLGYKTYFFKPNKSAHLRFGGLQSPPPLRVIENEFYRITINLNKGGAISSIYDKQANREVINRSNGHFANEIAVLREELTKKNVIYPAWEFWTTGERKFSTEKTAKVIFPSFANGRRNVIAIEGELPNMQKFVQTISLHKGVKRIDFKTELIDYKGRDELFVVNFPLDLTGGALVTEDRFGTVVRNGSRGFLDFRTNTDKLVSGAPVYAVNNWAEYGSTLDLNFVDAGGVTVASVPLKPTALVRPHGEIYEKLTEQIVSSLIRRGVSVTPFYDDNDAARRKNLTIEDSTMPKKLNDDIAYHNFRIALGGERENLYSAQLLKQISAEARVRFDERLRKGGFAYLFLYDRDVPKDFAPVPTLLIAGDVVEAIRNLLAPLAASEFAYLPAESLADANNLPRVPDYGVALINNGTPAVSLESPNTLTLFLTHTAIFPGVNLPFELVPENKTHVFNYALYPHAGDWREADTVKVGEAFNNPLVAVQTGVHAGDLPSEKSFLSVDKKNVIVSSLKLGGNPQANFRSIYKANERPLFVRFYESEGTKTNPMFTLASNGWEFGQAGILEGDADTLGSNGNGFGTEIGGFSIETFSLKPTKLEVQRTDRMLGATREIVQPVFSRYWLHNAGAAPIGNDAVKISLRRIEQTGELSTFAYDDKYNQGGTTTVAVRVQVVNNYQDRRYAGEVILDAPDDWRVVPDKLSFDIQPNGSFVRDVIVVGFPVKKDLEFERASGLIKARIEHEGQIFQDVLEIGKMKSLLWEYVCTGRGCGVKITNPNRQPVEGALASITPPENWAGGAYQNSSSLLQTIDGSKPFELFSPPREQGFSVGGGEEIYIKTNSVFQPASWHILRLVYSGRVEYKKAVWDRPL